MLRYKDILYLIRLNNLKLLLAFNYKEPSLYLTLLELTLSLIIKVIVVLIHFTAKVSLNLILTRGNLYYNLVVTALSYPYLYSTSRIP